MLERGARAATVDRIVAASGAPKGSIYHRFGTLDDLLAAMWLRAVRRSQEAFILAIDEGNPTEAAVAAGLAIYDFAAANHADARLLAALRREDLVTSVRDHELQDALREVNDRLGESIARLARRLYGRASASAIERTLCAAVDLPQGAIRRHLIAGRPFPPTLRDELEAAIRGALRGSGAG